MASFHEIGELGEWEYFSKCKCNNGKYVTESGKLEIMMAELVTFWRMTFPK